MLGDTVVVDEDAGRTDVGLLTDRGVADVGEVGDLRPGADGGVLGLDEAAELAVVAEGGAGTKVGEGADLGVGTDDGIDGMGAHHRGGLADRDVHEGGVRADGDVVGDGGGAFELCAGQDGDIAADGDLDVDPGGVRVDDGRSAAHRGLHGATVELGTGGGELDPVVDPGEFTGVVGTVGAHRVAVVAGDAEHVGEVELALGVVGAQPGQGVPQDGGVEGEDTGVDLGDGLFGGRGVLLLDDGSDLVLVVTDDAAVTVGVRQVRGEHRHGRRHLGVRGVQVTEGVAGQQRDVGVRHDDGALEPVQCGHGALDGVAGAELLLLHGEVNRGAEFAGDRLGGGADLVAAVTDDGDDALGGDGVRGVQTVRQQGPSADGVQGLLRGGFHAGPGTGGEYDDGDRLVLFSHDGRCPYTLAVDCGGGSRE